ELLPPSSIIITYILREVQKASVMKRRQEMRRKMNESTNAISMETAPRRIQPQIVDNFKKRAHLAEVTSYGQLEEVEEPALSFYEVDLGKRTRSGKDYEDTPTYPSLSAQQIQNQISEPLYRQSFK
ncbi:uncharacterized protein VP01_5612g1, partial [Puccinia sorghi]